MALNELPAGWRRAPLKDVAQYINGYPFKPSDWGKTGAPIIRIQNLNDDSKSYNYFGGQLDQRYLISRGDILISWSASLGAYKWGGPKAWLNQHIFKAVLREDVIDHDFFHFVMRREIDRIAESAHGSTMKHVTQKVFVNSLIPLPTQPEQRAIARALQAVQEAREARQRELALERERKAALMEFLFTHGTRGELVKATPIGPIPASWEVPTLGKLVADGPQNGLYKPAQAYGQGTPIIRINDFDNDGMFSSTELSRVRLSDEEVSRYGVNGGDILLNRVNSLSHVGKTVLVPRLAEPTVFESNMMRFRVAEGVALPEYVARYLVTGPCKARMRGMAKLAVAQCSINQTDVQSLRIPLPSISEQREITSAVQACDAKIEGLNKESALLDELFRAILEELMTGRLSAVPLIERQDDCPRE